MSRLRRLVLSDRFFFVICRLLPKRRTLAGSEMQCLAQVIRERREKRGFLLTAWVFLPDHWHAIVFPRHPLTISAVREAIKVGSTLRINSSRKELGLFRQPRFFDRALRTVKECREKVAYNHLNPVNAGLVSRAEDWPWSSLHEHRGSTNRVRATPSGLAIDRFLLPADERTRI